MVDKNKKTINFIHLFSQHDVTNKITDCWGLGLSVEECHNLVCEKANYNIEKWVIEHIYDLIDFQQDCDYEKMI